MNSDPPYLLWLAVAFVLSLTIYFALESDDEEKVYYLGSCGENAEYSLDLRTGLLEITGSGDLTENPWSVHSEYINRVEINGDINSIGERMFAYCTGISSVTLPDTVTSIGDSAFGACISLRSVTLPDSVTSVGFCAFAACIGLESVDLAKTVCIDDYAFYRCTSLGSVTIPDTVTYIGDFAFGKCASLQSIVIPDSVITVGEGAFSDCRGLETATVGKAVRFFKDGAFYNCPALRELEFNAVSSMDLEFTSNAFYGAGYSSGGFSVVFGDSVKHIPANLFCVIESSGQPNLVSVDTGDSVESIGESAFANCYYLGSVTIGESVETIGSGAFADCVLLSDLKFNAVLCSDIPSDHSVFCDAGRYCPGLSVEFGDSVKHIPANLFCVEKVLYEPRVTSVTMTDSVKSIGYGAFEDCLYLESIYVSGSVESIGSDAFGYSVFFDADGIAELAKYPIYLAGHTFKGSYTKLVKQSD